MLELPTDRPRPPVRTTAGAVHRRDLPADLVRRLTGAGQEHGATLFMTLVAAVQVLLSRYAGQRDVAVGTVISGRDRAELEHLVGFFVNTVVLRSDVDGARTFGEFLAEVRETVLDAFAHDEVPFDRLVDELQPERDPSRTPLVQAMVVLQQTHGAAARGRWTADHRVRPAAAVGPLRPRRRVPAPGRRAGPGHRVQHRPVRRRHDRADGRAPARCCWTASPPTRAAGWPTLPLLTDAERHQVLVEWNDTDSPVPAATVPELFEAQVAADPGRPPPWCPTAAQLTYAELNARANRLAHRLVGLGVRPDERVGGARRCRARSSWWWRCWRCSRPAGPTCRSTRELPAERMRSGAGRGRTPVLVTDGAWRDRPPGRPPWTRRSGGRAGTRRRGRTRSPIGDRCDPDNLAYVDLHLRLDRHAQGRRGARTATWSALAFDRAVPAAARTSGSLVHSPLAFDASHLRGVGAAAERRPGRRGAAGRAGRRHALRRLVDRARRDRAVADRRACSAWSRRTRPAACAGVREVWTGGDVVPAAARAPGAGRLPRAAVVVNGYGPTEATTFATVVPDA